MISTPWYKIEPTHIPLPFRSCNIGDYIQAEAASRLWDCRKYVDREHPSDWPSDAIIPLIGWWMHGNEPFIPKCQSIIVGIHIQNGYLKHFNDPKVIDYFKQMVHEQGFPAMCRDISTRDYFRSLGIDAEFGGCVTLTLPKHHWNRSGKYSVDCKNVTEGYVPIRHMISDLDDRTIDEKMELASEYLEMYQKAEHVETTRLHCWLPCQAFGTPVEFREEEVFYQKNRLNGYI